jgi:hypothetical protein
MLRNER